MRTIAHSALATRRRPVDRVAAIRAAIASGADRIELDVLSLDGELIVAHDPREAARAAAVAFSDCLGLLAAAGCDLLADIKNAAAAPALAEAIAAAQYGPKTVVSGELTPIELVGARSRAMRAWTLPSTDPAGPAARPGPLGSATRAAVARVAYAAEAAIRAGRCDAVSVDRRFLSERLVQRVHAAGGGVIVWTVQRAAELRALAALGVDEVTTSDPVGARRALRLG